jgi:hypothetical protein
MLFNATFNNISVRSWWSVLLVEETGVQIKSSIFVGFFQKIILQLIQVHRETDLMETMEVKYF